MSDLIIRTVVVLLLVVVVFLLCEKAISRRRGPSEDETAGTGVAPDDDGI